MRGKPDIASEVAALGDLSREELVERWRKSFGVPPPKGVRQDLLVRAAAWHHQSKRLGGMSAETRRLLRSAISRVEGEMLARNKRIVSKSNIENKKPDADGATVHECSSFGVGVTQRQRRQLTPGARLMREWNGRTHIVEVIEGGFVFEAKVYPSLTAIAGKITGVHWSGPRFFGL